MFEFSPIVGAFSITVKLVCCPTDKSFHLTNIYGPSNVVDRTYFIFCCYNFDTSQIYSRGDINLIRSRDNRNRNRPSGNVNDLAEISLEGRASLWSSIQSDRLVEKLEWVFTSSLWVIFYPSTSVQVLGHPISDHVPFMVKIGTHIPKSTVFHFENY